MSRPEHFAPPEIFYNAEESAKYASSSRIIEIQSRMSERAVELLLLPEDRSCMILDIGCGSGISGGVLEEMGHFWVGLDISPSMLEVAIDREAEGDMMLCDMGQGFKFRPGTFDGAISISALQWLMNVDKKGQEPFKRLKVFFQSLFDCLNRGARAVLQFYPETPQQVETITAAAMRAGFGGGMVVDFPHSSKAKKYFLVLYAGYVGRAPPEIPKGLDGSEMMEDVEEEGAVNVMQRRRQKRGKQANQKSTKEWILQKKEQYRRQGKLVKTDSKYTGRKRGRTKW